MKKTALSVTAGLTLIFNLLIFNCVAQYTKLYDFDSIKGANPRGSLISVGNFLYGTTYRGGTNDYGVIFKIKLDGTGYSKLLDFDKIKGSYPNGSLISDGIFLYGTTSTGGTNDDGTVFKIKLDGTRYSKLFDFGPHSGSNAGGAYGSLIFDGTFLYGTTHYGGSSFYYGTLFKIKPDGTGYAVILDFNVANGSYPMGSLISDGTFLYGMTWGGGAGTYKGGSGTIFKIKPDGTGYSKLLDFADYLNAGAHPCGSLIYDGTFLYGNTCHHEITDQGMGDTINTGTIFKIKPNGTDYSKLLDWDGKTSRFPDGSLVSVGNFLYGTIYEGGTNNYGTLFKIKPDGTEYSKLIEFESLNGSIGSSFDGSLISDGNFSAWNDGISYYYNTKQLASSTKQLIASTNGVPLKYDNEKIFTSITGAVLSGKLKAYSNFPTSGRVLTIKEFNNILVQWDSTAVIEDPDNPGKIINAPIKYEVKSDDITQLKFYETIEFDTVSYTLIKKVSTISFYTYKRTESGQEVGQKEIFYVKLNDLPNKQK